MIKKIKEQQYWLEVETDEDYYEFDYDYSIEEQLKEFPLSDEDKDKIYIAFLDALEDKKYGTWCEHCQAFVDVSQDYERCEIDYGDSYRWGYCDVKRCCECGKEICEE